MYSGVKGTSFPWSKGTIRVGPVLLGDVRKKDEGGQLLVAGFGTGGHQAVTAVVAVEGLVVADGAGILGPEFDLVEMEIGGAEIALGGVEKIRMEGQPVEVPGAVGELLDPGELAPGQVGKVGRIGEVVVGGREMKPEGLLRRLQLFGRQKSLHQGEAGVAYLIEGCLW